MAGKHWKLEVSELGSSGILFEGVVSAPTWLAALQAGRAQMGEEGGIPPGASCNVAPNGIVMIQDPRARRRYRLLPTDAPPAAKPTAAKAPAKKPAKPQAAPTAPKSVRRKLSSIPPPPPSEALGPLSSRPRPSSPSTSDAERKLVTLASRDENPTKGSPIHFRERMYAVPGPMHPGTAEKLATKLLRGLRQELKSTKGEKFVRIEIYDHVWREGPRQRPVVRVEWKSWNKTIDIQFPMEESARAPGTPRVSALPPHGEDRLKASFEACRDLLFLRNRAEALEFGVRLLEDLIAAEATAACLFDINTDEFRFVAARGRGAESRPSRAISSTAGLFGAAADLNGRSVLELADATKDKRYDPDIDGVPGLDVRAMLYRPLSHDGRLFGMLQLANGAGTGRFSEADCEVVDYVAQQLGEFLASGNSRPPPAK